MRQDELSQAAWAAIEYAYAPYSRYAVGAALLGADGNLYTGCNVENASYGLSICAERVALTKAVSQGCQRFTALYIVARGDTPWPCGACRQVLSEFAPDMPVTVQAQGGEPQTMTMRELLPQAFVITEIDRR